MTPPVLPIHTQAEREAALAAYEAFFDRQPAPGSAEADAFELLGLVIMGRKRELSLGDIRALHRQWGIPRRA